MARMSIADIAPLQQWRDMENDGYISKRPHPDGDLFIYNYTAKTQHTHVWNDVTLSSRGLIVDAEGTIVSRPFTKFFNYGELNDNDKNTLLTSDSTISVHDKLDGSLGISFVNPATQRIEIASRGSFTSVMALQATKIHQDSYENLWDADPDYTYLFEIITPETKVVLNYGDMEDIVLLGKINIDTGVSVPLSEVTEWKWRRAETFDSTSLSDALQLPPRENAEGVVIHFHDTDQRIKVKQDDYVKAHSNLVRLSTKRVWEAMRDNTFDDLVDSAEEEFKPQLLKVRDAFDTQQKNLKNDYKKRFEEVKNSIPEGMTNKGDIAKHVNSTVPARDAKIFLAMLFSNNDVPLNKVVFTSIQPKGKQSIFDTP